MVDRKLGLVAVSTPARPIQVMLDDAQMNANAFDDAIRAQLLHVAIGVGGAGSKTVRMLVDLSVWLSLDAYPQGSFKSGVLLIPAQFKRPTDSRHVLPWDADEFALPVAKRVCTTIYSCTNAHFDPQRSAVGDAFTLRLLFDSFDERQTEKMADVMCKQFAAWHEATTSLREAMAAIRSTLFEPQRQHFVYVPLLYRSASVYKGWQDRIVDPVSYDRCNTLAESWSEPKVPRQLSDLLAARCETLWSEAAEALHRPQPQEDELVEESEEFETSSDAADDYVCADRMLDFWYGGKRRRRRRS